MFSRGLDARQGVYRDVFAQPICNFCHFIFEEAIFVILLKKNMLSWGKKTRKLAGMI